MRIDPKRLKGSVVAIPVVNIPAFQAARRISPIDYSNMNRIFPGKNYGAMSEQIAHTIFEEIVNNAEYLIDLHSGGIELLMDSVVLYHKAGGNVEKMSESLAKVFGFPVIWQSAGDWLAGSIHTEAASKGVAAVTAEAGGEGRLREQCVRALYRGVMNSMRHLKMVPGKPEAAKEQTLISEANWVRTKRGGLLHPKAKLGAKVAKGEVLAVVRNLFGVETEAVTSPTDGLIVGMKTLPIVNTGDWTYLIGKMIKS